MRLENLKIEELENQRRVSARVVWESADRADQTLYFETAYPFASDLDASLDAFVLATLPFAVWHGEKHIRVEGPLCARLRDGLEAAMQIYARWYRRLRPLVIEPEGGWIPTRPRAEQRTASLLSGGIDGLAALRANRLAYPLDHPGYISSCLLLFGVNDFECTPEGPVPSRLAAFRRLEARLTALGHAENFELIPVQTNTRLLSPNYLCWASLGFGAANVAAAHAFSRRFSKVLLASDGGGVDPAPAGAHPLLDQHFSTAAVQVQHEHAAWTRMDKLRLLSEWPPALELMQPCHYIEIPPEGRINCGRCEKCLRTMMGLLTLGKLAEAKAFVDDDVTPAMLAGLRIETWGKADLLSQLIRPLQKIRRNDLVWVLRRRILWFRMNPRNLLRTD